MKEDAFKNKIEDIKARVSLPDIAASKYGLQLKGNGTSLTGLCPFHDDTNPSFQAKLGRKYWGFRCYSPSCLVNADGDKFHDVFDFVGFITYRSGWTRKGSQFTAVLEILEQFAGGAFSPTPVSRPAQKQKPTPKVTQEIKDIWDVALSVCGEVLHSQKDALGYLHGRGISNEIIARWRFGFWPRKPARGPSRIQAAMKLAGYNQDDLLGAMLLNEGSSGPYEAFGGRRGSAGMILFADITPAKKPAFIIARQMPGVDGPKYLYPLGSAKPLFGLGTLHRSEKPIGLVEGVINMIIGKEMGYDLVALGAASISLSQLAKLNWLNRAIIPLRDLDEAGQIALENWQKQLVGLPDGILLPAKVGGVKIKDLNDLYLAPNGASIFKDLAAQWQLFPREIKRELQK